MPRSRGELCGGGGHQQGPSGSYYADAACRDEVLSITSAHNQRNCRTGATATADSTIPNMSSHTGQTHANTHSQDEQGEREENEGDNSVTPALYGAVLSGLSGLSLESESESVRDSMELGGIDRMDSVGSHGNNITYNGNSPLPPAAFGRALGSPFCDAVAADAIGGDGRNHVSHQPMSPERVERGTVNSLYNGFTTVSNVSNVSNVPVDQLSIGSPLSSPLSEGSSPRSRLGSAGSAQTFMITSHSGHSRDSRDSRERERLGSTGSNNSGSYSHNSSSYNSSVPGSPTAAHAQRKVSVGNAHSAVISPLGSPMSTRRTNNTNSGNGGNGVTSSPPQLHKHSQLSLQPPPLEPLLPTSPGSDSYRSRDSRDSRDSRGSRGNSTPSSRGGNTPGSPPHSNTPIHSNTNTNSRSSHNSSPVMGVHEVFSLAGWSTPLPGQGSGSRSSTPTGADLYVFK